MTLFEQGSYFHLGSHSPSPDQRPAYFKTASLWASGRDALRALVQTRRWNRIWLPSYYCKEVVVALKNLEINIRIYEDFSAQCEFRPEDLCLVVNYFGLCQSIKIPGVTIIEDQTHDFLSDWAMQSQAAYCFASLRKSLPLPDGGILWSPIGLEVPAEIDATREHASIVAEKLEAMGLKSAYLAGNTNFKNRYRELEIASENRLGAGPLSGISGYSKKMLAAMPMKDWRTQRLANFQAVAGVLQYCSRVHLLLPDINSVPFSVIILFESVQLRDRVKSRLIDTQIYPAILWPNNSNSFCERHLSIHCDYRYSVSEMETVAHKLVSCL